MLPLEMPVSHIGLLTVLVPATQLELLAPGRALTIVGMWLVKQGIEKSVCAHVCFSNPAHKCSRGKKTRPTGEPWQGQAEEGTRVILGVPQTRLLHPHGLYGTGRLPSWPCRGREPGGQPAARVLLTEFCSPSAWLPIKK